MPVQWNQRLSNVANIRGSKGLDGGGGVVMSFKSNSNFQRFTRVLRLLVL